MTHHTTKLGLALAVAPFCMPTRAASLAGVRRIDKPYANTRPHCLVADKRSQLREGPIAVLCSLPWPFNPRPLTNTLEILKNNRPLRAFGFGNETLANTVIGILLKASLAACQPREVTFGRLRSSLLECLPTRGVPLAATLDVLTRKRFAVTISCESDDTEIDAKKAFDIARFWRLDFAGHKQIPLATDEREIGFTALCGKQLALAFATDERDCQPPVECPDRDFRSFEVVREDAIVVGTTFEGMLPGIDDLNCERVGEQGSLIQWKVSFKVLDLPLGYMTARSVRQQLIIRFYRMEWDQQQPRAPLPPELEPGEGWILMERTAPWSEIMADKIITAVEADLSGSTSS